VSQVASLKVGWCPAKTALALEGFKTADSGGVGIKNTAWSILFHWN